jgi:hypothetical protein
MNYRIDGRLFHDITLSNGDREIIAYDGKPMTNTEWDILCNLIIGESRQTIHRQHETNRALAFMAATRPNRF